MIESVYIVPGSKKSFNIRKILIETLTELNMYNSTMESAVNKIQRDLLKKFVVYAPNMKIDLNSELKEHIH